VRQAQTTADSEGTSIEQPQPFCTLELAVAVSMQSAAMALAMARLRAMDPEQSESQRRIVSVGDALGDTWLKYEWHTWWQPPTLWRDDVLWPDGETNVTIVRPDAALSYLSHPPTLYTSDTVRDFANRRRVSPPAGLQLPTVESRLTEFPLIRPRLPASDWQLTPVGRESHLGRASRRVHAKRRADSIRTDDRRLGFWRGVDEYECVIDEEFEIVLSVTGTVDGKPAGVMSVERISIDRPIPAAIFDFSPPSGASIALISE